MLFNSFSFLVFFFVVITLYFLLPHRYRWMLLLAASCLFYMAFIPYYILIIATTIIIDYYAGKRIEDSDGHERKAWLMVSIISTCLVLVVFKYFNFFNANISAIASLLDLRYPIGFLAIALPIGLSFHVFQSLSYVIEVYRGNQKAERHFGIYSLYVMFYPQLVAGPIERPQNLLHQFREEHSFEYERVVEGLRRMGWGLFKKIVIADNLAAYVGRVYDYPHGYGGLVLLVATFFFAVQIYCDFSGYSDIAIGAAQVMGFRLMENFKNPYLASSIQDFWSRWHISLSTWFRDYVYIPMGGNRSSVSRWRFNILVTFLLSGLWHGASWTYVAWGALNGIYMVVSRPAEPYFQKLPLFLRQITTFLLVLAAWAFFRANTLKDAAYIVAALPSGIVEIVRTLFTSVKHVNLLPVVDTLNVLSLTDGRKHFVFLLIVVAVLFAAELIDYRRGLWKSWKTQRAWVRWGISVVLALCIMNLGITLEVPFIYFQF